MLTEAVYSEDKSLMGLTRPRSPSHAGWARSSNCGALPVREGISLRWMLSSKDCRGKSMFGVGMQRKENAQGHE